MSDLLTGLGTLPRSEMQQGLLYRRPCILLTLPPLKKCTGNRTCSSEACDHVMQPRLTRRWGRVPETYFQVGTPVRDLLSRACKPTLVFEQADTVVWGALLGGVGLLRNVDDNAVEARSPASVLGIP